MSYKKILLFILDWLRGRFAYMYRRPTISLASYFSTFLGNLILRPKIYTYEDMEAWENLPKNKRKPLKGVGPVPAYMKKEFLYAKWDRTLKEGPDHIMGSILLSIYRKKVQQEMAWRVFLVAIGTCWVLTVAGMAFQSGGAYISKAYHEVSYSMSSDSIADAKPLDDLIDSSIKEQIAAKPSEKSKERLENLNGCSLLFGLSYRDHGAFEESVKKAEEPAQQAWFLVNFAKVCSKAGYAYHPNMLDELKPLKSEASAGTWNRIVSATFDPKDSDDKASSNFDSCPDDLQTVLHGTTNRQTVERAARCLAHGATLENTK